MKLIHNNTNIINDKEEFITACDFAHEALRYSENFNTDRTQWFFDQCIANWVEGRHTVVFKSFNLPEYKDYVLSIEVTGNRQEQYQFSLKMKQP